MWAVRVERRTDGPTDFAMWIDSRPDEARPRGENEVTRHPLPHEMKIVAVIPHVLTRPRNQIRLPVWVIRGGSRTSYATDVCLRVEDADRALGGGEVAEARDAHHRRENAAKARKAHQIFAGYPKSSMYYGGSTEPPCRSMCSPRYDRGAGSELFQISRTTFHDPSD